MKISWQDNECEGDFLYGMVSNSRYVAGTDVFTKDLFNWHDGLLEGLFIRRPMNLIELNAIIAGITRSDFSNPLFVQVQSPWFDFECKQAAWTLDGEFGGKHDHVMARAVPKALKMALSQNYIQSEGSSLVRHVGPEGSTSGSKYLAEEPKEHKALRSFWKDPDEYHPVKTETGAYIMAVEDSLIYHIPTTGSSSDSANEEKLGKVEEEANLDRVREEATLEKMREEADTEQIGSEKIAPEKIAPERMEAENKPESGAIQPETANDHREPEALEARLTGLEKKSMPRIELHLGRKETLK